MARKIRLGLIGAERPGDVVGALASAGVAGERATSN